MITVEPFPLSDAPQIAGLQASAAHLAHENAQLKHAVKTHEDNRARYETNMQSLKDQITDLQARLIKSQDRVSELQGKLLAVRAAAS